MNAARQAPSTAAPVYLRSAVQVRTSHHHHEGSLPACMGAHALPKQSRVEGKAHWCHVGAYGWGKKQNKVSTVQEPAPSQEQCVQKWKDWASTATLSRYEYFATTGALSSCSALKCYPTMYGERECEIWRVARCTLRTAKPWGTCLYQLALDNPSVRCQCAVPNTVP